MKLFLAALALTLAVPAAAQSGAADPHAGHAQPASDPHAGHKMEGGCCEKGADGKMKPCCEKAAAGKKMACCEKKAAHSHDHKDGAH